MSYTEHRRYIIGEELVWDARQAQCGVLVPSGKFLASLCLGSHLALRTGFKKVTWETHHQVACRGAFCYYSELLLLQASGVCRGLVIHFYLQFATGGLSLNSAGEELRSLGFI